MRRILRTSLFGGSLIGLGITSLTCTIDWRSEFVKATGVPFIFKEPASYWGPGTVVMVSSDGWATPVCKVQDYLDGVLTLDDTGRKADLTWEQQERLTGTVKLSAAEVAKLGGSYASEQKLRLAVTNGRLVRPSAASGVDTNLLKSGALLQSKACLGNMLVHAKADREFRLILQSHRYDLAVQRWTGSTWSAEFSKDAIDILGKKAELQIAGGGNSASVFGLTGSGLFVGYGPGDYVTLDPTAASLDKCTAEEIDAQLNMGTSWNSCSNSPLNAQANGVALNFGSAATRIHADYDDNAHPTHRVCGNLGGDLQIDLVHSLGQGERKLLSTSINTQPHSVHNRPYSYTLEIERPSFVLPNGKKRYYSVLGTITHYLGRTVVDMDVRILCNR